MDPEHMRADARRPARARRARSTSTTSAPATRRSPSCTLPHRRAQDRPLVRGRRCRRGPEATTIVRAIIALAHNLGLEAIAEGIDHPDQIAKLRALGCEYAQGFLFSEPVDAQATQRLIANWDTTVRPTVVAAVPA